MLAWMFETVWHAVLGLILLAGVTVTSVVVLARSIHQGIDHEWRKCTCPKCADRRDRAFDRRVKSGEFDTGRVRKGNPNRRGWITTRELSVGMRVETVQQLSYRVTDMIPILGGIEVHLCSLLTGRPSQVLVKNLDMRYWKPIDSWRTR